MLICRELGQPAQFPGNEHFWNSIDDNSYAPSLADLIIHATTHDHCKNEDFLHCNGDVFVWKYLWQDVAKYFGVEVRRFFFSYSSFSFPFCFFLFWPP
jgi:nucleoside-diphosphate-sugar epimerase